MNSPWPLKAYNTDRFCKNDDLKNWNKNITPSNFAIMQQSKINYFSKLYTLYFNIVSIIQCSYKCNAIKNNPLRFYHRKVGWRFFDLNISEIVYLSFCRCRPIWKSFKYRLRNIQKRQFFGEKFSRVVSADWWSWRLW